MRKNKTLIATVTVATIAVLAVLGTLLVNVVRNDDASQVKQSESVSVASASPEDMMFAAMMIPHHQQAVEMADIMLAKSDISADVRDLATQIKNAQDPEIVQMQGWLASWNAENYMTMDHSQHMGGMLESDQIDALKAASGEDAEKQFMQGMIAHHQGAIAMAEAVSDSRLPEVKELAQNIMTSQTEEIIGMSKALGIETLPSNALKMINDEGIHATTVTELIDKLEATSLKSRPASLIASIRPNELLLSNKSSDTEVKVNMPADQFYLSVAPYRNKTHDCYNHSLTTCTGELANTKFNVRVTDNAGSTVIDKEVTSGDNGFIGLWLPRGIEGKITVSDGSGSGTVSLNTSGADAPTCLTGLRLQ